MVDVSVLRTYESATEQVLGDSRACGRVGAKNIVVCFGVIYSLL